VVRKTRKSLEQLACEAKVSWPSRKLALKARQRQIDHLDFDGRDRIIMAVYRCPVCSAWHVGREDVAKLRYKRREHHDYQLERELDLEPD
jgi:hypothetical protein